MSLEGEFCWVGPDQRDGIDAHLQEKEEVRMTWHPYPWALTPFSYVQQKIRKRRGASLRRPRLILLEIRKQFPQPA